MLDGGGKKKGQTLPSLREHVEFSSFCKYVWVICGVTVASLLEDCYREGVIKAMNKAATTDIVLLEFYAVQDPGQPAWGSCLTHVEKPVHGMSALSCYLTLS